MTLGEIIATALLAPMLEELAEEEKRLEQNRKAALTLSAKPPEQLRRQMEADVANEVLDEHARSKNAFARMVVGKGVNAKTKFPKVGFTDRAGAAQLAREGRGHQVLTVDVPVGPSAP